jgi:hypothetical protein
MGQTAEFAAGSWIVRQPPGEKKNKTCSLKYVMNTPVKLRV